MKNPPVINDIVKIYILELKNCYDFIELGRSLSYNYYGSGDSDFFNCSHNVFEQMRNYPWSKLNYLTIPT